MTRDFAGLSAATATATTAATTTAATAAPAEPTQVSAKYTPTGRPSTGISFPVIKSQQFAVLHFFTFSD